MDAQWAHRIPLLGSFLRLPTLCGLSRGGISTTGWSHYTLNPQDAGRVRTPDNSVRQPSRQPPAACANFCRVASFCRQPPAPAGLPTASTSACQAFSADTQLSTFAAGASPGQGTAATGSAAAQHCQGITATPSSWCGVSARLERTSCLGGTAQGNRVPLRGSRHRRFLLRSRKPLLR